VRWTPFRSVASAGGSVVADPECLRRREEGETGDEDRSDDIFFTTQGGGRGCNSNEKKGPNRRSRQSFGRLSCEERRPVFRLVLYLFSHDQRTRTRAAFRSSLRSDSSNRLSRSQSSLYISSGLVVLRSEEG
jgi:hypothetical protein